MFIRLICAATTFALIVGGIHTMPLHPDLVERLRAEGKLDAVTRSMGEARAKGGYLSLAEAMKPLARSHVYNSSSWPSFNSP